MNGTGQCDHVKNESTVRCSRSRVLPLLIAVVLLSVISIFIATLPGADGDYPAFRNEHTRDAFVNTSLPSSLRLSWDTNIDRGYIDASPIYAEGKIFVATGGEYPDSAPTVAAMDAVTGEIAWTTTIEGKGWQLSTPCCDHGKLFVGSTSGVFYCFDITNGNELWRFSTTPSVNGIVSSPVVYDGTVFFGGDDGFVYALDAVTGDPEWVFETLSPIYFSSPCINPDEGVLYIGNDGGFLFCISIDDGREVWNLNVGERIRSTPASYEGHVYFTVHDGCLYSVDTGGDISWTRDIDARGSSPAVHDGRVYVGGDELYCISVDNDILWSYGTGGGGAVQSSPTVTHDALLFSTNNDASGVYCLDLDGELRWEYVPEPHDYMLASPITVDEKVYVASDNGHVYCLEAEESTAPEIVHFRTDDGIYEIGETLEISGEVRDRNGTHDIVEINIDIYILNNTGSAGNGTGGAAQQRGTECRGAVERGASDERKVAGFGMDNLSLSILDDETIGFEISVSLDNYEAGEYFVRLEVRDSGDEIDLDEIYFTVQKKKPDDESIFESTAILLPIIGACAALLAAGAFIFMKERGKENEGTGESGGHGGTDDENDDIVSCPTCGGETRYSEEEADHYCWECEEYVDEMNQE